MADTQLSIEKKIYKGMAEEYAPRLSSDFAAQLKWKLVEKYASAHYACLDVGIANGILAVPLARLVRSVVGIDLSREMLGLSREFAANQSVTNLRLVECNADALPIQGQTFDLVYSYSTLVLVTKREQAYQAIYQALKPNGIAILDITGRYNLSRVHWNTYYTRRGHPGLSYHSLNEITRLLEAMGFEILETHSSGFLDQWKYIPLIRHMVFLHKLFHVSIDGQDLDYKISQLLPSFANRWYFVLRKRK